MPELNTFSRLDIAITPRRAVIPSLAILTISDAGFRGEREDTSGDAISSIMARAGFREVRRDLVPDEQALISRRLAEWCDGGDVDLVVTTGGTGLGPRDVTPEAMGAVIEQEVPGIAEAMRARSLAKTPMAMLSRARVGVRNGCLIVNLPGSPKGVEECLEVAMEVIPHALEVIEGRRGHPARQSPPEATVQPSLLSPEGQEDDGAPDHHIELPRE